MRVLRFPSLFGSEETYKKYSGGIFFAWVGNYSDILIYTVISLALEQKCGFNRKTDFCIIQLRQSSWIQYH